MGAQWAWGRVPGSPGRVSGMGGALTGAHCLAPATSPRLQEALPPGEFKLVALPWPGLGAPTTEASESSLLARAPCPTGCPCLPRGPAQALHTRQYLQIFFVFINVVQLQNVRVFDELQDGDLPLHLLGDKRSSGGQARYLPPAAPGWAVGDADATPPCPPGVSGWSLRGRGPCPLDASAESWGQQEAWRRASLAMGSAPLWTGPSHPRDITQGAASRPLHPGPARPSVGWAPVRSPGPCH